MHHPSPRPDRTALLLASLVFALLLPWFLRPIYNIDVFWHVATGWEILDHGVPRTDIFSAAHPDAPWVTFQWGYEALVGGLERLGGLRAVQLLHVGAMAGAGAGFFHLLHRLGGLPAALSGLLFLLATFDVRVRVRPHALELLFVVLLLPLVAERVRGAGARVGAVLLAVLWANIHAVSAAWWLALVGAWAVGAPRDRGRWLTLAAGALGMVAIPQAREGALHAMQSHSSWPSELVPELRRTLELVDLSWWGPAMIACVAAGLACALDLARRRDQPAGLRIAALGCAVAAALIARWIWFAAVPVGLWLALATPWRRAAPAVVGGLSVLLMVAAGAGGPLQGRTALLAPGAFPVDALDWLEARDLRLPADIQNAWSGYYLYRTWPGGTVIGDGRLLMQPDVVELLLRRADGDSTTFDEAVGRYRTALLLWPTDGPPPLDEARWRAVYQDPVATIWAPRPAWPLFEAAVEPEAP